MKRTNTYTIKQTINYDKINPNNIKLVNDFVDYCTAVDKSNETIILYTKQLKVFMCWLYNYNNDEYFINLKKKDFISFFAYLRSNIKLSSATILGYKAVLSSFSNAIELLYEDKYPLFRNQVSKLDIGTKIPILKKTILDENTITYMLDTLTKMKKYQLACYLALLVSSGARRGEMPQMKLSFFDKNHEVFGGYMYTTDPIRTKGKGVGGKVISRYVIKNTFKPYLELWLKERKKKKKKIKSEYLFVKKNTKNKLYDQINVKNADVFSKNISKIFNNNFYNHCARHFFCTKLIRMNIPTNIICEIIQWESENLVKVYNDISRDELLEMYFDKDGYKENYRFLG